MKKYLEPTMEICTFEAEDIVRTSGGELIPPGVGDNETPIG